MGRYSTYRSTRQPCDFILFYVLTFGPALLGHTQSVLQCSLPYPVYTLAACLGLATLFDSFVCIELVNTFISLASTHKVSLERYCHKDIMKACSLLHIQ